MRKVVSSSEAADSGKRWLLSRRNSARGTRDEGLFFNLRSVRAAPMVPTTGERLMVVAMSGLVGFIAWVLFVAVWIALAFWPARVAGRKGHSFFGYFILSLIFWPLALILAYVVKDRGRPGMLDAPAPSFGPDPTDGL